MIPFILLGALASVHTATGSDHLEILHEEAGAGPGWFSFILGGDLNTIRFEREAEGLQERGGIGMFMQNATGSFIYAGLGFGGNNPDAEVHVQSRLAPTEGQGTLVHDDLAPGEPGGFGGPLTITRAYEHETRLVVFFAAAEGTWSFRLLTNPGGEILSVASATGIVHATGDEFAGLADARVGRAAHLMIDGIVDVEAEHAFFGHLTRDGNFGTPLPADGRVESPDGERSCPCWFHGANDPHDFRRGSPGAYRFHWDSSAPMAEPILLGADAYFAPTDQAGPDPA